MVDVPQEQLFEFNVRGEVRHGDAVPNDAVEVFVNVTPSPGTGWACVVSGDQTTRPEASSNNQSPAGFNPNCVPVKLGSRGTLKLWSSAGGQFVVDVFGFTRPFDSGPGGHFGVAGDWWPSGAADVGVRRFQNWGHLCTSDEQMQAVRESNYQLPDANEFARRFRAMVEGVKRVDPSARICGPSTLFYAQDVNARAWWRGLLTTGAGSLMDRIGHHSYTAHAVHDFANEERYWLVDPPTLLSELRLLRADCDADPTVAGKPILVSEGSMIHAEGPAGLPPDHPLVVAEARRFFGEFLPTLKLEIGRLGVEAFLVFQTTETKWNDRQIVPNPVGMYDESGRLTEYARSLAALAAS
jgi:hypothetical protein